MPMTPVPQVTTIPPGVVPSGFNPNAPVSSISSYAMRGLYVLQNFGHMPFAEVRQQLTANVADVAALNGFRALPDEIKGLFTTLHDPQAEPASIEDLSRSFRMISGSPFLGAEGGMMGDALRFISTATPPDDLFTQRTTTGASSLMPGGLSDWNRNAGTVIGHAGKLVNNAFVRATGLGEERPEQEHHHGVERITRSVFAPLPLPETVEEGEALYRRAQAEEIAATELYKTQQMARMTDKERTAFVEADAHIRQVYSQRPALKTLLAKVRAAGGYPDSSKLNEAKWNLDEAVHHSKYLSARKIGPREFQVLSIRRLADTWKGTASEQRFLREQALGQERDYVLETLLMMVTQGMRDRKPPSEWKRYENLAAEAIEIYDRLLKGEETRSTDETDLARIRSFAFPFEIDWNDDALAPVLAAKQALEGEREAFRIVSSNFVAQIGVESTKATEEAEAMSMAREKRDSEFQMIRLQEQFGRLARAVQQKGGEISSDHQAHFAAAVEAYKDSFQDYQKFWGPYVRGEDVKAREHARNGKDKDTLYNLCFRAQWALEELFEIYDKQYNLEELQVVDSQGKKRARPSCVSFSYTNSLRAMDEAVDKNAVTSDNIEAYFSAVWALAPDATREIGITIPGTKITLGGRRIPANAVLDQLSTIAGSFFSGEATGATTYLGLENKAYLVAQIPAHPEVSMMAGVDAVFKTEFFSRTNISQQGVFLTANHSGILEFLMMIEMGLLGIHAPQFAQGGAAVAPVFGDYLRARTVVGERDEGSGAANKKIANFIMRAMAILAYPSGTRLVSAAGGHPFAPDQTLGWRTPTDRFTSGQVPKIALQLQEMAGNTKQDFLVATVVQNGARILPEPTWFLGKQFIEIILGNLSPKTLLNMERHGQERQIGFGPMFSSAGFLSEERWKQVAPSSFVHADGQKYSDREAYVQALQLNANVISALQLITAAGMDLAEPPAPTAAQEKRREELEGLSQEERRRLTEEPMDRHLRERVGHLGLASRKIPAKPEARQPLPPLDAQEKQRLEAVVPTAEADRLIHGLVPVDQDKAKAAAARAAMREAVQRGAAYAQQHGDTLALDGDKVLWDHFYEVDPSQIPDVLRSEMLDQLSGPEGSGSTIPEWINVNPQWVAFILGYRKVVGRGPVLFSSTLAPRLQEMAKHVDSNPLVKALFESLLGENHLTSQSAIRSLARGEGSETPRIITRQRIADYVVQTMERFRASGFNLKVFSDIERQDILTMLRTNGDVHLKYRGLYAYGALVDDRNENVDHASDYSSEKDPVLVLQQQTFTSNPVRIYLVSSTETDVRSRLNEGRSGHALEVMRHLEGSERRDGLVRFDRRRRPQKIKGLMDRPVRIEMTRDMIRTHYQDVRDDAERAVAQAQSDIAVGAASQRDNHINTRTALARLLRDRQTFGNVVIPPARLKNALKLLDPSDRGWADIKGDADFEMIDWLIRRIPDAGIQASADLLVSSLKNRDQIDLWADVSKSRKGSSSRGNPMKTAQKAGAAIAKYVPPAAMAFGQSLQHIVGNAMREELVGWRNILKLLTSHEQRLLFKLGRFLEKGSPKLSSREMAEAYGVVAERLGTKIAKRALTNALQNHELSQETRDRLRAEQKEIEQRIERVGEILKKTIIDGWALIDAAIKVYGDVKDLGQAVGELTSGTVMDGITEFVRGQLASLWNEVRERRQKSGMNETALPDASVATQIADNILNEGIRIAGGEESAIGWLLFQARLTLHQLGLDESIRRAMDLPANFQFFRNNGDAKEIAKLLRNRDEDSAESAETLLRAAANHMKARNATKGKDEFQRLFATAWRHCHADDRAHLEDMSRRVYQDVFSKPVPQLTAVNG